jgi:pimeloyl-ACP methyl ester carboxylesterase
MLQSTRLPVIAIMATIVVAAATDGRAGDRRADDRNSMSVVDRESARRSEQRNFERYLRTGKPLPAKAGNYTIVSHTIPSGVTGSGFAEPLRIMLPGGFNPNGPDLPLLLVGNGWGLSPNSFFTGDNGMPLSGIVDEANSRGWLICVVTQLDDKSYGAWNKPQTNVVAALDHMIANYPVDADRIYAIGWSAGGGSMASFAARHLDPARPMIAAVVVNAGSVDLIDTYDNEVLVVKQVMENVNLFQGPPSSPLYQFNYERTETVFTHSAGGAVVPERSQVRNLSRIPVRHVYSLDDDIPYLPLQNQMFGQQLLAVGGNLSTQTFSGLPDPHSWDLLDPVVTLDWCAQHVVERAPASFQLVIDRDATWYYATTSQRVAGTGSRLAVATNAATNHLAIGEMANLDTVSLAIPSQLLALDERFTITATNLDAAGPVMLQISPLPMEPSYVLSGAGVITDWTYVGQTLRITMPAAATRNFTVEFETYDAALTGAPTVQTGQNMVLNLQGQTPGKPYLLLLGTQTYETPLSVLDPLDPRHVLVAVTPATVLLLANLDGAAKATLPIFIPAQPQFQGITFASQFLTYPGTGTIVDELSNLLLVEVE